MKNELKTHCPHGHPYSKENTMVSRDGKRACRACKREAHNRWAKSIKGREWRRDYREANL